MANRRDLIKMSPGEVDAFLHEERVLNVATLGPGGWPHVVPMWFAVLDGRPAFWTFAKSQKIHNLRRDDRLTALVEAGHTYSELRGVELVGRGRIVDDPAEVVAIGRAVGVRYAGGLPLSDAALATLEAQAPKRLGVVLAVERVVSWDHRKLAAGSY